MSSEKMVEPESTSGTWLLTILRARPSAMAVLPTPGSPTRDPAIDLPYAAWAELLGYLGEEDDHVTARAAGDTSVIGYRRYDMEVELSGGWTLDLPGAFAGRWEDDGARYWATDGTRVIDFTSLTADGATDSAALLAVALEHHTVIERIDEATRRGRVEAYDDGDVHVVHGLMASAPEVAILTCKVARDDEAWALATWRSLRQA